VRLGSDVHPMQGNTQAVLLTVVERLGPMSDTARACVGCYIESQGESWAAHSLGLSIGGALIPRSRYGC